MEKHSNSEVPETLKQKIVRYFFMGLMALAIFLSATACNKDNSVIPNKGISTFVISSTDKDTIVSGSTSSSTQVVLSHIVIKNNGPAAIFSQLPVTLTADPTVPVTVLRLYNSADIQIDSQPVAGSGEIAFAFDQIVIPFLGEITLTVKGSIGPIQSQGTVNVAVTANDAKNIIVHSGTARGSSPGAVVTIIPG